MANYTIKDVEKITGIKAHTLRVWEKRYNFLAPTRNNSNKRFYSDNQLRHLINISSLLNRGYKISMLANSTSIEVENLLRELEQKHYFTGIRLNEFIACVLDMNEVQFMNMWHQIIKRNGFQHSIEHLIFPLLREIGTLWQTNTIRSVHEHFLSNLIRQKFLYEIEKLTRSNCSRRVKVLFFTPENEQHDLAILYFHYITRVNGWHSIFIGTNIPFDDLVDLIAEKEPEYVFTNFVNGIQRENLEDYINNLRNSVDSTRILITGLQIRKLSPTIPQSVTIITNAKQFASKINEWDKKLDQAKELSVNQ